MSVQQLKRRFLVSFALVLSATPLFALNPAARSESRMVFSPALHRIVLYGGSTNIDRGTAQVYELDDTWERVGTQWVQRFPAHNPGKRSAHVMVYDSGRGRILLFAGRTGNTILNDTWSYENGDWLPIPTATVPTPRYLAGGAFDSARNRFVVFGGNQISADGKTVNGVYDTWEFDGTNWKQTNASGPQVLKPILVYDKARDQIIMLGVDAKSATLMYAYDAASSTWKQITPTTLPACANEATMAYNDATQKVFFTGGVCTGSSATEDNLEWDGTNWTKVDVTLPAGRVFGATMTYDSDHNQIVMFGGANIANTFRSNTMLYANGIWIDVTATGLEPQPRSLFAFVTDPVNQQILMFGGIDDAQTFTDFWKFQNGRWTLVENGDEPTNCIYPLAVYDTDRQKTVLLCGDSSTWEYDGTAWKGAAPKHVPSLRRFSSMAYDQTLKKTVLFGGYDTNYFNTTWVWDGTDWTQVAKKNPPPSRALAAMWYDPTLKKTVMYGGVGRISSTDRVTFFSDQWTFDGNQWTQVNAVKDNAGQSTGTPGMRYGAQITVDPTTNKVLLYGGLLITPDSEGAPQTEAYADDTWQFDGTNWTKLSPSVAPPARENAGLTFDPVRNELVMFSGFAATYRTDTWGYSNGAWHQRINEGLQPKRRAAR
jgi:hypothetical protein